jgi:hypothetical protein
MIRTRGLVGAPNSRSGGHKFESPVRIRMDPHNFTRYGITTTVHRSRVESGLQGQK